jgi:hypothetical protein
MREKQYADIEGLSLMVILERPWWYPSIAVCQEARVRAFLAEGLDAQALSEAKSYYDVAPLAETPTAIELLGEALARTRGASIADQFRNQATAAIEESSDTQSSNAALLKSIHVNDSIYADGIARTRAGSEQYAFANQMSQGELLLLSDEPAAAEDSFIKACSYVKNEWDLPEAVDGIARCLRDLDDGSLRRARKFRSCLATGDSSKTIGIVLAANLDPDELRESGRRLVLPTTEDVARAKLADPPQSALGAVNLPPADSEKPFDFEANGLPAGDPVLFSRLASQGDPALRNWLERWESGFRRGQTVDEPQAEELDGIVTRSKLSTETLLSMCSAYDAISGDDSTATGWLVVCADRIDPKFGAWVRSSEIGAGNGSPEGNVAQVRASCEVLCQFGNALYEVIGDTRVAADICAAAVARGHEELAQFGSFRDEMRPILRAMKGCEALLWKTGSAHLHSIDVINTDLERWVPVGDSQLGWTRGWAKIGHSDYLLYSEGKSDKAIAACEKVAPGDLTADQRTALAYTYAMALNKAGRYREAIPQLKTATASGDHAYTAWAALAKTLAYIGDKDASRSAFQEWVRRFQPGDTDMNSVYEFMEKSGVY